MNLTIHSATHRRFLYTPVHLAIFAYLHVDLSRLHFFGVSFEPLRMSKHWIGIAILIWHFGSRKTLQGPSVGMHFKQTAS